MRGSTSTIIGSALALATHAAGADTSADSVPKPRLDQQYQGDVTALGYFTPAEEADPAWEAYRRTFILHGKVAPLPRIISREVRWFPPGRPGDPPCARIIYMVSRSDVANQSAGAAQRQDLARRDILAREPRAPMEQGCGIKDPRRTHYPDSGQYDRDQERRAAAIRTSALRCDGVARHPASPLRLYPATRLAVTTRIDDMLPAARPAATVLMLADQPAGIIARRSYAVLWPAPPAIAFGNLAEDGRNILIVQRLGVSRAGTGYCVELTARQGGKIWSRTIERPVVPPPRTGGTDRMGFSTAPDRYWTLESDAVAIADRLANDLGIPKRSVPANSD